MRAAGIIGRLRTAGGFALGLAIPVGALGGAAPSPGALAATLRADLATLATPAARRAEVAVAFDSRGQVASSILTRSTGSRPSDEAALDAAVQLARLQPSAAVAGRTLVFKARFSAAG